MADSGAQVGMCYRGEFRVLFGILGCSPLDYKISKVAEQASFLSDAPMAKALHTAGVHYPVEGSSRGALQKR